MHISDILRHKGIHTVHTIGPDRTILDAVQALVHHEVGSLVVTSANDVVGIITERDIMKTSAHDHNGIVRTRVEDVMSRGVIFGKSDDTVNDVMRLMTEKRIRHLPIMEDNRLAGMVSIGDVVNSKLDEAETEIKDLQSYITGR